MKSMHMFATSLLDWIGQPLAYSGYTRSGTPSRRKYRDKSMLPREFCGAKIMRKMISQTLTKRH